MTEIQVENIIISFCACSTLDLPKLAEILPDSAYHPEDAPAIILQFAHPHSMAALSSSGEVVMTGLKNFEEADDVVKMIQDRLEVVGVEYVESPELTVQNVTVSTDLHQELKLRDLAKSLQNSEYSPRKFPGLVYKGNDPNTVILLFDSGKMVCNGKTIEEATVAVEEMIKKLVSIGIKMEEKVCQK